MASLARTDILGATAAGAVAVGAVTVAIAVAMQAVDDGRSGDAESAILVQILGCRVVFGVVVRYPFRVVARVLCGLALEKKV